MVEETKSRLLFSSLSVKEVAFSLHFSEPNHMMRFFKSQTGHYEVQQQSGSRPYLQGHAECSGSQGKLITASDSRTMHIATYTCGNANGRTGYFAFLNNVVSSRWYPEFIDITAKGVDKAKGMKDMITWYGIPPFPDGCFRRWRQ